MSERERLLCALRGGTPLPPPTAPIYLSLYLEPRRRRHLAAVYAEMAEGRSSLRLTFEEEVEARVEAIGRSLAEFADPPAWMPVGLGPSRAAVDGAEVTFPPGRCVWHPPGGGEPVDFLAPYSAAHPPLWQLGDDLPTPEALEATARTPDPDEWLEAGMGEYPARVVERFGDRFVPTALTGTPFWHCYARLGFAGMMRALRERPEVIDTAVRIDAPPPIAQAQALRNAGVGCVFVEECLSSSDMISPADFERFAYPSTRDLLAAFKDLGLLVVYYFCGGVERRLERLAELPADALAFEESKKSFKLDLARIRSEIGPEPLLLGNTDVVLLRDGTEEQIAADVARQCDAAGPRFVVSMGSPATPDTSPAKLDMLVRAGRRLAGVRAGGRASPRAGVDRA